MSFYAAKLLLYPKDGTGVRFLGIQVPVLCIYSLLARFYLPCESSLNATGLSSDGSRRTNFGKWKIGFQSFLAHHSVEESRRVDFQFCS